MKSGHIKPLWSWLEDSQVQVLPLWGSEPFLHLFGKKSLNLPRIHGEWVLLKTVGNWIQMSEVWSLIWVTVKVCLCVTGDVPTKNFDGTENCSLSRWSKTLHVEVTLKVFVYKLLPEGFMKQIIKITWIKPKNYPLIVTFMLLFLLYRHILGNTINLKMK